MYCGSVCQSGEPPIGEILELETRPKSSRDRRLSNGLEQSGGLRFPPFCLVGRCICHCVETKSQILLIAPVWRNQYWYPLLLGSLFNYPTLIPSQVDLLKNPDGESHPLCQQQRLVLAAWPISGVKGVTEKFLVTLSESLGTRSEIIQENHISQHGALTEAGVVKGMKIPFGSLFPMS